MDFISTRDKSNLISGSKAIIEGIAEDGGLFVPRIIPKIDKIESLKNMDYKEIAYKIMSKFLDDFNLEILKESIDKAYDDKFSKKEICSLVDFGELYFLELFHGPTFAFKDMALSILPYLLKQSMEANEEDKEILILTATSGDTGKAALENFANVEGIKIIVFFPEDGVSEIQKLQMRTQEGDNTFVVSINGNFDDAQNGVKEIFNDKEFIEELNEENYKLSSANSINIGRLIPQIVYYFYTYGKLLGDGKIKDGEKINFVVPTGNFGNILAGYYSKKMGLPINKLICASNDNNVLTKFINTGIYDRRKKLALTSSPSMDILISSNLERLLYHLSGGNDLLIKDLMIKLERDGVYELENLDIKDFKGYYANEEEVSESIKKVFEEKDYLMDPHTAVAYSAYEKYRKESKDPRKTVIISTASPFKFPSKIESSLENKIEDKNEFEIINKLGKISKQEIPENIKNLKDKDILHKTKCEKEDIKDIIRDFLLKDEKND